MPLVTSLASAPAELERRYATLHNKHRLSLDTMRHIMDALGNPQDAYPVVHVAGTSGKTSTCYYTTALLRETGMKVGLTVSPHVDLVNERVQINMQPLPEAEFCREINEFTALVDRLGLRPSYFELLYAFAFWEFARQRVDYAVVEVGIGGLLDNTNVINRPGKTCIITDIGMDHMSVLGNTLPEIATQKAGIMQLHNPVFCWRQSPDIMAQIEHTARQQQADLHILETPQLGPAFSFLPAFQRRNFELALETVRFTLEQSGRRLPDADHLVLAAHSTVPGRMELFEQAGKHIVIDGSHNPQKLHALAEGIRKQFPGQPVAALVAFATTKAPEHRIGGSMDELMSLADYLIITTYLIGRAKPHRSYNPETIANYCRKGGYTSFEIIDEPEVAFAALCKRPEPVLLVAGSFFLLNHIRPLVATASA